MTDEIKPFRFPDDERAKWVATYGEEQTQRFEAHITKESALMVKRMWEGTGTGEPKGLLP